MLRQKGDSVEAGGLYKGNFQNFVNGFGNTDFDLPYWFGVKNMKKITDQVTVDLNVNYWEGNQMKYDVFHNFVILDDDYRMTYNYHWDQERGGSIFIISFCIFILNFVVLKSLMAMLQSLLIRTKC